MLSKFGIADQPNVTILSDPGPRGADKIKRFLDLPLSWIPTTWIFKGGDLRYALQLWQKAGVMLSAKWLSETGGPTPLTLPRPHWLAGLWWRLKALFQFRRNVAGEFGTFIPIAAAG